MGIDTEVGKNLADLRGINLALHEPCFGYPDQRDGFTDQPPQHWQHLFDNAVYLKNL